MHRQHRLVSLLGQGHRGHLGVFGKVGGRPGVAGDCIPSLSRLPLPVPMVPVEKGLKIQWLLGKLMTNSVIGDVRAD